MMNETKTHLADKVEDAAVRGGRGVPPCQAGREAMEPITKQPTHINLDLDEIDDLTFHIPLSQHLTFHDIRFYVPSSTDSTVQHSVAFIKSSR